MAASCADLGSLYIKLKNYAEAYKYFDKSLHLSMLVGFKDVIRNSYEGLYRLDSIKGDYRQAFKHHQQYILYRDSIINRESLSKSVQSRMQYEFDKKDAVAKAEQDKKDADAKRIENQQYFAIAALGIIVLAVAVIAVIQFRSNKHKQQANIALQQQKQKVESTLAELKSTQAQLIQSEKMASLGELTAGIAHEIQNPLNFVNNFSEVNRELVDEMEEALRNDDKQEAITIASDIRQNLEKINHHGKRADAIVKGMLQHSRTSSSQKEQTNINALADENLRLAYHGQRAKEKSFNASLQTDFDKTIGNINIIPQDIGRVLLNLYNNAFYACTERSRSAGNEKNASTSSAGQSYEPTVSVSTKKVDNKVEISVKDNGIGIPQKVLDKSISHSSPQSQQGREQGWAYH